MQDPAASAVDGDLAKLEAGIRQLKVQYDMYFAGALPRQPVDLRADLERIIRRHSLIPPRKYAARFHFNALVSRYNSLSELWSKTLRSLEEGDRPAPPVAERAGGREQVVTTCRLQDAGRDRDSLRHLHRRYLEARRKAGEAEGALSFGTFLKGVAAQTQRLREKTGCEDVELRIVVVDRKVQLKARPGR